MVKAGKCLSVAFLASAVSYELGPGPFTEPNVNTQSYWYHFTFQEHSLAILV